MSHLREHKKVPKMPKTPSLTYLKTLSVFQCASTRIVVCDYLTIEEIQTLKSSDEFKPEELLQSQSQRLAQALLSCIKQADLKGVHKILQPDQNYSGRWQSMFCQVEHITENGTQEIISPARYTAKIFDTYARNLLLSYVPDESKPLFWEHVSQQKYHIDLEPLFQAYIGYIELYGRWVNSYITTPERDKYWNTQHGKRIRELALHACHFIKEMGRTNEDWSLEAKFDNPTPPDDFLIYDFRAGHQCIPISKLILELGTSVSLSRGRTGTTDIVRTGSSPSSAGAWDNFLGFHRLFEVRKTDLTNQVAKLKSDVPGFSR